MTDLSVEKKYGFNPVYQRRIRSYCDFIWKVMIAHNVYTNLDLSQHQSKGKLKVFVGPGNNCNMIKGLLKRRFWWTVVDQYSQDCLFVWSQLRNHRLFMHQEQAEVNSSSYVEGREGQGKKHQRNHRMKFLKKQYKEMQNEYSSHRKIWNEVDFSLMQDYIIQSQLSSRSEDRELMTVRDQHFSSKNKHISTFIKHIKEI